MANLLYPKFKDALLTGAANSVLSSGTVKAALIDLADYTYSAAHEFYSSVPGAAVVGTPQTLASKTTASGLFDAADCVFSAVTGDPCEAVLIYIDTGTGSTSRLVGLFDTGVTGLPVTPNGGDINLVWNASGIFQL